MSKDSGDSVMKTVLPTIKTGRKWKVVEVTVYVKECLKIKELTDGKGRGSSLTK